MRKHRTVKTRSGVSRYPNARGCNGIEVALSTAHKPFVIFITAYDQYALEAFKASAVDYLLKPVEEEPLATAVDKFKRLIRPVPGCEEILHRLVDRLESLNHRRLAVSIGDSIKLIPYDEIVCFEADNKYTTPLTGFIRSLAPFIPLKQRFIP